MTSLRLTRTGGGFRPEQGGTQKTPATRKAPVLSNDQMRAIAAAPVWTLRK
ncbi:hypothetical protein ACGF07_30835 [Kitasatospora sp. NPDC048194]|uniref:hypothetical protein n=1 Tax=Kitasatospora sp. NPDC048194 TaxID=3364045 RepID=UPI0037110939